MTGATTPGHASRPPDRRAPASSQPDGVAPSASTASSASGVVSVSGVLSDVTVVIPTVGRPSLHRLLDSLAVQDVLPARIVVVDDAGDPQDPVVAPAPRLAGIVDVARSSGSGPAAARNAGWRVARTKWVVVLDDDTLVPPDWSARLAADLAGAGPLVGAVQGRIRVPLPDGRPTDWERQVAGLESAAWATADLALRRDALAAVGGFDERFPRAFREDADLAIRLRAAGWELVRGGHETIHPVPPADPLISVRRQAGNADDARMRVLHGRDWRARAEAPAGRRPRHLLITAAAVVAGAAAVRGRGRLATLAGLVWAGGTAEFAAARIVPGPRTPHEVATMALTSVLIPPAAVGHWLRGWAGVIRGRLTKDPGGPDTTAPLPRPARPRDRTAAVLFDRDGTLLVDVPYNGDPHRVRPVDGARAALDRLRAEGIATGVVSNQSGVARGLIDRSQVDAVNDRMIDLLGPLGPVEVCPHGPSDGCSCRKPAPGLVTAAARRLGVSPSDCVVVGDIGSDVAAAHAAGARAVLVPTAVTRPQEVAEAPVVADSVSDAVRLIVEGAV